MKRMHLCGPPAATSTTSAKKIYAGGKDIGLAKHDGNAGSASSENKSLTGETKKSWQASSLKGKPTKPPAKTPAG